MKWNWELKEWPKLHYDSDLLIQRERQFLLGVGHACGFLKSIQENEYKQFIVEILSSEGIESSKIEGEILDRESLQSSIQRHFGLKDSGREKNKESGMADVLCNIYETFEKPLEHQNLWDWHSQLFKDQNHIVDRGRYRTHIEPMQIVSRRYDNTRVFFEAPPSARVSEEMENYLKWFNTYSSEPILGRAAIAHVYFESLHPFEDGNGRIGRLLVEKLLSQGIGKPVLITISRVLERRKKEYYSALERCNRTLEVTPWVEFFSEVILQAQKESLDFLQFLIEKSKLLTRLSGQINLRQEKAILKMFEAGLSGFLGGLSAENYISMTKASRATATRDLSDLVEKGALLKTGELRHTRYWLNIAV